MPSKSRTTKNLKPCKGQGSQGKELEQHESHARVQLEPHKDQALPIKTKQELSNRNQTNNRARQNALDVILVLMAQSQEKRWGIRTWRLRRIRII